MTFHWKSSKFNNIFDNIYKRLKFTQRFCDKINACDKFVKWCGVKSSTRKTVYKNSRLLTGWYQIARANNHLDKHETTTLVLTMAQITYKHETTNRVLTMAQRLFGPWSMTMAQIAYKHETTTQVLQLPIPWPK